MKRHGMHQFLTILGNGVMDLVDNDLYDGMGGPALIAHYYGKDEELQEIL